MAASLNRLANQAHELTPAIELRGVSKRFGDAAEGVVAISEVSLSIAEGEFIGIVGPSGCGKSTLLHMIAGLTLPTSGEITVNGHRVDKPNTDIGIVFQAAELLPWRTALANVLLQAEMRRMDKKEAESRARSLLARVGLEGFEQRYPEELSGGMQQRVSLVRALLHGPSMLIMDEPFGALDALTREQMQFDLQQLFLSNETTVIFVTHDIEEAVALADRVIVMSPRPSKIAAVLPIDLERPRRSSDRASGQFQGYVQTLRQYFTQMGILHEE